MSLSRLVAVLVVAMLVNSTLHATETKDVLQKRWPKADAVISRYHTTITFYFDQISQKPMVMIKDEMDIVPLKGQSIERYCFYDNTSSVSDVSFQKNGKSRQWHSTLSGDWESSEVFHSDEKFFKYQVAVDPTATFYQFRSVVRITDLHFFTKYFFNDPLYPVSSRTVDIEVPQWLELASKDFNFAYFNVSFSKEEKPLSTIYKYKTGEIPTIVNQQFMLSGAYTYPHLLLQIKSYRDQNNINHNVFNDLNGFYAWIKGLYKNLQTNNETIGLLVKDVTKDCTSRNDSIEAIYYWVQDNIRYIAFEDGLAGLIPDQASAVLQKKYGDCKGMSNLLKTMLCAAGFDARLAWMGTNSLIYDFSLPNTSVCNHMICYLNDNSTDYYLDATQKLLLLGSNNDGIQGKQVMVEDGDTCFIKTIPTNNAQTNAELINADMVLNGVELSGKVAISYYGCKKWSIANLLAQQKTSDHKSLINKLVLANNSHSIDSVNFSETGVRDTVFNVGYFAKAKNQTISAGTDIFFLPDFLATTAWANIDTTDVYHINLGMKTHIVSTICVQLSPSMSCTSTPKDEHYCDGPFTYSINYQQKQSSIVYKSILSIDQTIVHKPDFKRFTQFRKKYHNARTRPLVLQKT